MHCCTFNHSRHPRKHHFPLLFKSQPFRRFSTSVTMISFSSGLDSAIISVIATSAPFDMNIFPEVVKSNPFFCRNARNRVAPIRLQLSLDDHWPSLLLSDKHPLRTQADRQNQIFPPVHLSSSLYRRHQRKGRTSSS